MRILLTGGTGLIGRHAIDRLAPNHELVALARTPPDDDRVEWIAADLSQPLEGLPDRIDAVVHLAQSQRYREFPEGAEDVFAVNVQSTFALLEHARRSGASSFVLASSGGIYAPTDGPIDEDGEIAAPSAYPRSKLIGELLAASYEEFFSCAVLRPFFVYGAGGRHALVTRLAGQIGAGEEIAIEGMPGMRINPIHASDAALAIEAALELEGSETLNVAGGEIVTISELAERLAAALGREARLRDSGGESPGDLIGDATRMREVLGIEPGVSLDEGLRIVAGSLDD